MGDKKLINNVFKFITDVLAWTCICLLVLIGICMLWYFIAAQVYASKGQKYEPYFSLYTIISPSMDPAIKVYDVILDTRVDDVNKIKEGDVITFISTGSLSNGMTVTHRVVEVVKQNDKTMFRTKGDNNQTPDGALVQPENVLGKTLLKIPQLGRVQFLLAKRGAWFIVVLIPAIGIIVYDLVKLFQTSKLKSKIENVLDDSEPKEDPEKKAREQKRKEELKKKLNIGNKEEKVEDVKENALKEEPLDNEVSEDQSLEEKPHKTIDIEFDDDDIEEERE